MPVAREDLARPDPTPYVNYAKRCSDEKLPTIYVLARGANVLLAEWAVEDIEKKGLYKKQNAWKYEMTGKRDTEGYVALLSEPPDSPAK
jgi:hypothetical protein